MLILFLKVVTFHKCVEDKGSTTLIACAIILEKAALQLRNLGTALQIVSTIDSAAKFAA